MSSAMTIILLFLIFFVVFVPIIVVFLINNLIKKEHRQKIEDTKELMRYQYELEHQNEKK